MQVTKVGDKLAVLLPDTLVNALDLKEGDEVEVNLLANRESEVHHDKQREEALEVLRRLSRPFPSDFKFDREEANAR